MFGSTSVYGQLKANFTVSATEGCAPLQVTFTSTSTGNPVAWRWYVLGPGNVPFTIENPSATYVNGGKYTISLVVVDANGNTDSVTVANLINVFPKPDVKFTASPREGCVPFSVNFTDQTVTNGASITEYTWTWEEGFSKAANPTGTFSSPITVPTTYDVTLSVKDNNGCVNGIKLDDYITAKPQPKNTFKISPPSACEAPLVANFIADETAPGYTYTWTSGGQAGSFSGNPVIGVTYNTPGKYPITLTVTGPGGCMSTSTKTDAVIIEKPVANFSIPSKICANQAATFNNASTGTNNAYEWDFSNLPKSQGISPAHTFPDSGFYKVCLLAKSPNGQCRDSICQTIFVERPIADFSPRTFYSCKPEAVTFTNLSKSAVTYNWSFSPGTSNNYSPTQTFTVGSHNVVLEATSAGGCKSTAVGNVLIKRMIPQFNYTPTIGGCVPLAVSFTDVSISDSTITNWDWDFGDGQTSTAKNPVHTFTKDGDLTVTLTITNKLGCKESISAFVIVGKKPKASFDQDRFYQCAGDTINYFDRSTVDDTIHKVDYWKWTFTSPQSQKEYGTRNPQFENAQDTGYFAIELIVGYNGCLDTIRKTNNSFRFGPFVKTNTADKICAGKEVTLYSTVRNYDSYTWNYGDGDIDTIFNNTTKKVVYPPDSSYVDSLDFKATDHGVATKIHHYDNPGNYKVKVMAGKSGLVWHPLGKDTLIACPYWDSTIVTVPDFRADFILRDSVCYKTADTATAVNFGKAVRFQWILDGISVSSGFAKTWTFDDKRFLDSGPHRLDLVVTDSVGCTDTASQILQIIRPRPVILSASPPMGCAPLVVNYSGTDTSGVPIESWLWNFGSASPSTSLIQNPPPVTYNTAGTYPVTLTTVYAGGLCRNSVSLTTPIQVSTPVADFDFQKLVVCQGDSIRLINKSAPANVTTRWYFSNGDSSYAKNPAIFAANFGSLEVTLIADIGGSCYDTLKRTVIIEPKPKADFISLGPTESNCYPFVGVSFVSISTPSSYTNYTYKWDFGVGTSANDTASTSYFNPGNYDVSLVVTTEFGGCKDSIFKDDFIKVRGPSANFIISDTNVCVKDEVTFCIFDRVNVESYNWDFGDGVIEPGDSTFTSPADTNCTSHSYTAVGYRYPIVTLTSGDCKVSIVKSIFVNDVVAKFSLPLDPNAKVGIDTLRGCGFYDFTGVFESGLGGNIDKFYWQLNNGQPINETDTTISQVYFPGFHSVYLAVSDSASGCKDTLYQNLIVFPEAVATAGPDVTLCPKDSTILTGSGGVSYEWSPGSGLNTTLAPVVISNPGVTTAYQLEVTDINGCKDVDSVTVFRDRTSIDFALASHTGCGLLQVAPVNQSTGTVFNWLFDNTTPSTDPAPVFTYFTPGQHFIQLTGYDIDPKCVQTKLDTIEVFALPIVNIPPDHTNCLGDTFLIHGQISGADPVAITWSPGIGLSSTTVPNPYAYPSVKTKYTVTVTDKNCTSTDSITIDVDLALAAFTVATIDTCYQLPVRITNNSVGKQFRWQFTGNPLDVSSDKDPTFTYTLPGTYTITLEVVDIDTKCKKTATQTVVIHPAPPVVATGDGFMCNYDSLLFTATGARSYVWTPQPDLGTPLSASTYCYADQSGRYYVTGTDDNGCSATDSVDIIVQPDYVIPTQENDTIVIGEIVSYDLTAGPGNISYSWTPTEFLNCTNCPNVTLQPLRNICYRIDFNDDRGCYPKFTEFCIIVDEKYTVDVPNAFTPNEDGRNDKLYVRGFGIKKLLNFTIYNRWGEVVFESTDMAVGWDGKYKDKIQNDETYAFVVNAETWSGKVLSKNGYITLLK